MVSEKVLLFQGKNRDLSLLCQQIVFYLQTDGYKVQSTAAPLGFVIQAQKTGILRGKAEREKKKLTAISKLT